MFVNMAVQQWSALAAFPLQEALFLTAQLGGILGLPRAAGLRAVVNCEHPAGPSSGTAGPTWGKLQRHQLPFQTW